MGDARQRRPARVSVTQHADTRAKLSPPGPSSSARGARPTTSLPSPTSTAAADAFASAVDVHVACACSRSRPSRTVCRSVGHLSPHCQKPRQCCHAGLRSQSDGRPAADACICPPPPKLYSIDSAGPLPATTPDMHHETVDPLKTEPGFGLSVPRRQRHGMAWCESGAEPGKLRRCIAHQMRHGAPKWRAPRDRRTLDGGKRFSAGFYSDLAKKKVPRTLGRRR